MNCLMSDFFFFTKLLFIIISLGEFLMILQESDSFDICFR